ncbi:ROK family protein [Pedobacter helvus]|uniref:ROK family protein n=1 Tax=Pedobacter helvus TaxID=2563444 RepID=A0ABW9JD04_9SPHI|nr:ROK family protein [Pedobacter ureilyticus]
MSEKLVLGADIGGSHVTVGIIDLQINAVLSQTKFRLELNSKGDLESILTAWQQAIERSCELFGNTPSFLGISMPGPLDYARGISLINGQDKYDALFGLNIKELLAKRIQMPVSHIGFVNDAVSFLKGEILGGAASKGKNVIGLTLGTGLGSAKALNGSQVLDADLWKMPFKESIAEEYLSTRWFVKRYFEKTGNEIPNVKALLVLAEAGKIEALEVFSEFGNNLGLFLQLFIEMEGEVDTVVLGGNIAKTAHLFTAEVIKVLGSSNKVVIKPAILGEDAALIGAAGIWKTEKTQELA